MHRLSVSQFAVFHDKACLSYQCVSFRLRQFGKRALLEAIGCPPNVSYIKCNGAKMQRQLVSFVHKHITRFIDGLLPFSQASVGSLGVFCGAFSSSQHARFWCFRGRRICD